MYLDVCMVEHDDASRKAESTTFAEPAHRLGTAVDDSFFLVCKRADSIASYNNRVVMRDNTFVIAISLICMPDNTVANYRNRVVGRVDRVVTAHNSLATCARRICTCHKGMDSHRQRMCSRQQSLYT